MPSESIAPTKAERTRTQLLQAAEQVLLRHGYAGLSTRRVADAVGAPMSQIQYHFGSKSGLVLALFESMNARLLERQECLFNDPELSLAERWERACDYLDEDIESGYVRVLHELMAAGWAEPDVRDALAEGLDGWQRLLTRAAEQADGAIGPLAPFTPSEVASLVGSAFIGAESQLLLGREDDSLSPIRKALRRVADVIRAAETKGGAA